VAVVLLAALKQLLEGQLGLLAVEGAVPVEVVLHGLLIDHRGGQLVVEQCDDGAVGLGATLAGLLGELSRVGLDLSLLTTLTDQMSEPVGGGRLAVGGGGAGGLSFGGAGAPVSAHL